MVKFCTETYPTSKEQQYSEYFEKYSFPLSTFQKFAIEAIVEGHHSLSCVPTGSGKTMPAIFAIDFFTSKKKKVIYTSPIKALSNQKYYELAVMFLLSVCQPFVDRRHRILFASLLSTSRPSSNKCRVF